MTGHSLHLVHIPVSALICCLRWPLKPENTSARFRMLVAPLVVILLAVVGCESATPNPAATSGDTEHDQPIGASLVETSNPAGDRGLAETFAADYPAEEGGDWQAVFIEGTKLGYVHVLRKPVDESLMRITSTSELSLKRFGQTVSMKITWWSEETPDGRLVRCSCRSTGGSGDTQTTARVDGNQLVLETTTLGKTLTDSIPWDSSWGGYFVDQVSLERQPMQPGEKRTLRGLLPVINKLGEFRLEAVEHELVEMLSGNEQELLRIDGSITFEGGAIDTMAWTNAAGKPLKVISSFSGLEQVHFRTTKEMAVGVRGTGQFDLGQRTLVKTERQLAAPHQTKRVVYWIRLADADPAKAFASGPSQSVEPIDEHTAKITVRALRPDSESSAVADDAPTDADRDPNNLIQSDDPMIVQMAQQVTGAEDDPWALACALERRVGSVVQTKNFSQAMASAAEVVRSGEGDCTEHAVLLAALCRARQIPARVALGLVYYAAAGGFAYHMWNEVWIRDRWIPLDGTLGAAGIGAGHLKVSTSNLKGVSPYNALLPVLNVLGQPELKILEVE